MKTKILSFEKNHKEEKNPKDPEFRIVTKGRHGNLIYLTNDLQEKKNQGMLFT